MVRPENDGSYKTSFAVSGEEMTMVETLPSLIDIPGPYVLERFARDWWGLSPRWRMLPMIGNGRGPGGRLAVTGFGRIRLSLRR